MRVEVRYAYETRTEAGRDLAYSDTASYSVPTLDPGAASVAFRLRPRNDVGTWYDGPRRATRKHKDEIGENEDEEGLLDVVLVGEALYEPLMLHPLDPDGYGDLPPRPAVPSDLARVGDLLTGTPWIEKLRALEGEGKSVRPRGNTKTKFDRDLSGDAREGVLEALSSIAILDGRVYRRVAEPTYRLNKGTLTIVDAPSVGWAEGTFFRLDETGLLEETMEAAFGERGRERALAMAARAPVVDASALRADFSLAQLVSASKALLHDTQWHLPDMPLSSMSAWADLEETVSPSRVNRGENPDPDRLTSAMTELCRNLEASSMRSTEKATALARIQVRAWASRAERLPRTAEREDDLAALASLG